MKAFFAFLVASLLVSCTKSARPEGQVTLREEGESKIGTYISTEHTFATSSYWIEGPTGLIFIDTQFLPIAAEKMLNAAEILTGKKVEMAIVLHPNPDKFNGTTTLQKRGIKVLTSDQVKAAIPKVHELRKGWFFDMYKPDYPSNAAVPDSFGAKTTELEAGGTKIKLHVMGKGCSDAHVVAQWGEHLFPGDLVTNGFHSWLELGYLDEWIQRIEQLKKLDVSYVYPGRGEAGDISLLDTEETYLKEVRRIVKAQRPKGKPTSKQIKALNAAIESRFPDLYFTKFAENGAEELWKRYSR